MLGAALTLSGCAKGQSGMTQGWMATFSPAPKLHTRASHRHATRVFRQAAKAAPHAIDPDLVTGSVTPIAAPIMPKTVLAACKQRLYLETATSTEELRAAEAACKDVIVNAPIGGGAN